VNRPLAPSRRGDPADVERILPGEHPLPPSAELGNSGGNLFIIEQTFREKGGPPRHLHYEHDEWFYAVEGEYLVEAAPEKTRLKAGDSLFAPRKVPHAWAFVGDALGRLLVGFTPAGKMEAFFREVTKADAMPSQDLALWRAHGMEVVGPPLSVR
jgi:quercetin dioxygenase-like cupin family protein